MYAASGASARSLRSWRAVSSWRTGSISCSGYGNHLWRPGPGRPLCLGGLRQEVDIDFSLQDIPVKESQAQGPLYTMQLSPEATFKDEEGEAYQAVTFRLPNGEDQEVVSPLVADDAARGFAVLLGRCIQSIGPWEHPGEALLRRLSPWPSRRSNARSKPWLPRWN